MSATDDGTTEDARITGNAWDRQEGESDQAWAVFKIYRDMGLTRSVPKVAKELGRPRTTLAYYSTKHSWVMRAAAYDAEQDRLDQIWIQEERKKAVKRHIRQAQSLQSVWINRLQTLDPNTLSASETLKYAEIATKLERDALRLTEPDVSVTVNLPAVEALSAEDTRVRLAQLQKEIEARTAQVEDVVDAEVVEEGAE